MIFREDFFLAHRQTNTHKYRQKDKPKGRASRMNTNKNDVMLHNMIPLIENRFCPTFFRFRSKKILSEEKSDYRRKLCKKLPACLEQFQWLYFNTIYVTIHVRCEIMCTSYTVRVTDVALYLACIQL